MTVPEECGKMGCISAGHQKCFYFTSEVSETSISATRDRFQGVTANFEAGNSAFGEGNGNPLQYSCLENPMDRGAWWATVHGVAKSRTGLSGFTFTFAFNPALERRNFSFFSRTRKNWELGAPSPLLSPAPLCLWFHGLHPPTSHHLLVSSITS